jgi:hypothetical protein
MYSSTPWQPSSKFILISLACKVLKISQFHRSMRSIIFFPPQTYRRLQMNNETEIKSKTGKIENKLSSDDADLAIIEKCISYRG